MTWVCSWLSRICLIFLYLSQLWHLLKVLLMTEQSMQSVVLSANHLIYGSACLNQTCLSISTLNRGREYCSRSRSTYSLRLFEFLLLKSLTELPLSLLRWWSHVHNLLLWNSPSIVLLCLHIAPLQLLWKFKSRTHLRWSCLSRLGRISAKLASRFKIDHFLPASRHSFSLSWVADRVLGHASSQKTLLCIQMRLGGMDHIFVLSFLLVQLPSFHRFH